MGTQVRGGTGPRAAGRQRDLEVSAEPGGHGPAAGMTQYVRGECGRGAQAHEQTVGRRSPVSLLSTLRMESL